MSRSQPSARASALRIRLKKLTDGRTAISCTRGDGSVSWQRPGAAHAGFFARHDLTHYAVETVLGYRLGFFGLIAAGWDFTDFGEPWPRGPIPADADPAELIVGFLDAERSGPTSARVATSAAEFNAYAAQFYAERGAAGPPVLTDGQLDLIRSKTRELVGRWDAVEPGGVMELLFETRS